MKSRFEVKIWDAEGFDPSREIQWVDFCVSITEFQKVGYLPDNAELITRHGTKGSFQSQAEADTYAREFIEKLNKDETYE